MINLVDSPGPIILSPRTRKRGVIYSSDEYEEEIIVLPKKRRAVKDILSIPPLVPWGSLSTLDKYRIKMRGVGLPEHGTKVEIKNRYTKYRLKCIQYSQVPECNRKSLREILREVEKEEGKVAVGGMVRYSTHEETAETKASVKDHNLKYGACSML